MTARLTIKGYELLEQIGEGGMGVVWKARRQDSGDLVAIKVMAPQVARNPILLKRFEQEFRVTSKLDHPNIVRAMEAGTAGDSPYLVMEFVDGKSLGERIDKSGKIPEEEAIRIIVQIAHGLHRAHRQGLIHRDVKPDNIMVTPDGQAKLLDLGLAKDSDAESNLTKTGRGLGTPDFMAPEQFRDAKNASIKCDVYSLGATLYMMVTGKLPFDETDPVNALMRKLKGEVKAPRQLNPALSERCDRAILRAMNGDPEQRPGSCREFAEDLLGQSTRPDPASIPDTWYVVYPDAEGNQKTAKGTVASVQRMLEDGQLGDRGRVRVSRSTTGPFEPINEVLVFRPQPAGKRVQIPPATSAPAAPPATAQELLATPSGAEPPASPGMEWWKILLAVGLAFLAAFLAFRFLIPS